MADTIQIRKYAGDLARFYVLELAALRIEVFREFPYLYDGELDYEMQYLERYFKAPGARIFIVFHEQKIIDASTCLPLSEEMQEIRQPFEEQNLNLSEYFYFGESILKKKYRGQGIGKRFFELRKFSALQVPGMRYTAFCAVVRNENHSLRPLYYQSLIPFWKRMGYAVQPGMYAQLSWKEPGQKESTNKQLQCWIKKTY